MSNPYYDPQVLEDRLQRVARLRMVADLPAPWDIDPNVERWQRGLGAGPDTEDFLNSHMLDWQIWLPSLTAEQRANYQALHPEPHGWGLYRLVFSLPTPPEIPKDKGPDVYWDSLEKHYETVFGVA
jgi:hypothetical protein